MLAVACVVVCLHVLDLANISSSSCFLFFLNVVALANASFSMVVVFACVSFSKG